jgi:Domain of unknown function (DUF222)
MRPDPLFDPAGDGQEPDGSLPPAAAGDGTGAEPGQQGLYLCLPAGSCDADRFAQSGPAADMTPDPLLATVIDTLAGEDGKGLAGLSDDQLIGVIAAVRRLESRAAWYLMSAVAEFAARRADEPAIAEFAAAELAAELRLTGASAAAQMDYATTVTSRLPATCAALHAGTIHPVHARIIEDETSILSPEDAARADAALAAVAGSLTFGKLRSAAHRLVLELDPDAAQRRKDAASGDAHVRRFREDSGNAGMVARELPPDEVLASWQHIEQRALDLRTAGIPGTLQELRVRAFADLLQERDSRPAEPGPDSTIETDNPPDDGTGTGGNDGSGPGGNGGGGGPGHSSGGRGRSGAPDIGPSVAALVNITVPWSSAVGESGTPADVAGFGQVHATDARDLLAAAARDPRTRWCVTALHPDGTAAAHGCVAGRHPPPGTSNSALTPGPGSGPGPPPSIRPQDLIGRLHITLTPIAHGTCGHDRAEPGYRPSRKLQHLVKVRNARCTAPGCGRAAARCDLDHTIAWHLGGLTCECDLAPGCKR